jgi:ketosteroid isomerase-like protein
MSQANVDLVQGLYDAFKRGDIAHIIDSADPDIDWESVGRACDYPGFGPRRGLAALEEFFRTVAENLKFSEFSPQQFHRADDKVFALGHYGMTVTKTGCRSESDWIHVFTIRGGKVTAFREFSDTARLAEAYRGA